MAVLKVLPHVTPGVHAPRPARPARPQPLPLFGKLLCVRKSRRVSLRRKKSLGSDVFFTLLSAADEKKGIENENATAADSQRTERARERERERE